MVQFSMWANCQRCFGRQRAVPRTSCGCTLARRRMFETTSQSKKIQAYIEGGIETSKSYIPTTDSFISFLDHDKDGTVTCKDIVSHCNDFSDYVVAKAQEYYPEALVALLLSYTMPLYTRFLEIELFQKFLSMAFVSTILQFLTELPASYLDAIQVWWYCHVPAESLKTPLSSIFSLAFWKATLIKLVYRDEELISFITECVAVFTGYSIWYPFILSLKPNCAEKDVDVKMSAEEFDSDSDEFKENR